MKKLSILFFGIILILNSCTLNKSKFLIINKSTIAIDSIKVSCSGSDYKNKSTLFNIKNNDSVNVSLNMEGIKKIDGNYQIEVFSDVIKRVKHFGYYTNGISNESLYLIKVKSDTIVISEEINSL